MSFVTIVIALVGLLAMTREETEESRHLNSLDVFGRLAILTMKFHYP